MGPQGGNFHKEVQKSWMGRRRLHQRIGSRLVRIRDAGCPPADRTILAGERLNMSPAGVPRGSIKQWMRIKQAAFSSKDKILGVEFLTRRGLCPKVGGNANEQEMDTR